MSLQITLLSTFIFTNIARILNLIKLILPIRFLKFLNLKIVKLKKDFLKHTGHLTPELQTVPESREMVPPAVPTL